MSEQPRVRTTEGVVQGRRRQSDTVFRGIPYAQPPVGALRFAAPAPPHRWEGIRQAVEFGPVVPLSLPIDVPPQGTGWLTLNVGTPDPGAAGLPVLVWIPVGGYLSAVSNDPMYDPAALTEAGVVVVTINCRVGAEGFAYLDDVPPNRGFLDQIAALEWVQSNIAAFGGDPGRVTVGGVSAGGGVGRRPPDDDVRAWAVPAGHRPLGAGAVQHPRAGPAGHRRVRGPARRGRPHRRGPAPDRPVAPGCRAHLLQRRPARAPGDLGTAHRDRHRAVLGRRRRGAAGNALARADRRARERDGTAGRPHPRRIPVFQRRERTVRHLHRAGRPRRPGLLAPQPHGARAYRAAFPRAGPEELVETVYSDALFRMPSQKLAEANAVAGGTSYLFELCWGAPVLGGILGACHSLDVPLAFGTLDSPVGTQLIGEEPTPEAVALSRELRQAWVRFVTTGDAEVPAHRPGGHLTRVLDTESKTLPYPEQASRQIWAGHSPAPFDLS